MKEKKLFSKWHKIDLHIHTDKSKETKENDYQGTFSVNDLYDSIIKNEIEMISFTDHNIINTEAYNELEKKGFPYLIGVELDIAIDNDVLRTYINSLKDKQNQEKIDIKPFHTLLFFRSKNITELSNKIEKMFKSISSNVLNNEIDLGTEKLLRVTTLEYIVKSLISEDYFLIAHGNKDKGIVKPFSKSQKIQEAQYEILIGEISALEMKSNSNIQHVIASYNDGFRKLIDSDFQKSDTTGYVVFSDNHCSSDYKLNDFQTWIKGQLDYETLRIAFSDPSSRIFTSTTKPKSTTNYIEEIKLVFSDQRTEDIKLSPYLNVIIGGRSSGKSLLFNTLLNSNSNLSGDDKKLFNTIYKDFIDSDKTIIKDNITGYSQNTSIKSEAYYQERIIDLFKDDANLQDKLSDFFTSFNEDEIKKKEKEVSDHFDNLARDYKDVFDCQAKIEKGNISQIITNSIKESKKIFDIDTNRLSVKPTVNSHNSIIEKLGALIENLSDGKDFKFNDNKLFSDEEIRKFNDLIKIIELKSEYINSSLFKAKVLELFYGKIDTIIEEYTSNELDQDKQIIIFAKDKLDNDLTDYRKYFSAKIKLYKTCKAIENINIKVENKIKKTDKYTFISKLDFEINKESIITELFQSSLVGYNANLTIYENLVQMANPKTSIRVKQKTIDGKKPETLKIKIDDFVRNNKSKKAFEILENGDNPVSSLSTSQGRKASMFLDIKLNDFIENQGKNVLFIDQIEDNIDNKYIGEELVSLIRKLRNNMQVIIVTHNPSIAIYGDAENIIIAQNKEGKISFTQGGLENPVIRHESCEILDGGDIAFKNRMDKYNITKISK